MDGVDSSDLSNKPFHIIASRSALFHPAGHHVCLFLDVIIPTPV